MPWETELDTVEPARVSAVLRGGTVLLTEAGLDSPEADAAILLAHAWDIDHATLNRRRLFDELVPAEITSAFAGLCEQRRRRVPLQHLTGIAHFRHLDLRVGPGVFVPRPETELLAGAVLDELTQHHRGDRPFVIDLCSGSGAITLSVATEFDGVDILGVERETAALEWAQSNLASTRLGESTVEFVAADATSLTRTHPHLLARADVVVTNPPYVPDDAVPKDPEVADYDPAAALFGGTTGLEVPALIITESAQLLRPGGLFLMEHGEEQGSGVRELLDSTASLRGARTHRDYTGRDRYTVARRES